MNSLILVLFGLAALTTLVVVLVNFVRRSREQREAGVEQRPRTAEEKETDRRTGWIWAVVLLLVLGGLLLAYTLTSST